jgi:hypothetical protein
MAAIEGAAEAVLATISGPQAPAAESTSTGSPLAAEWHPDPVPESEPSADTQPPQFVPHHYAIPTPQYTHPMYAHGAVGYGQAPPGMPPYPQPQFFHQPQYDPQNYAPQQPQPPPVHWQQQQQMMMMPMMAPIGNPNEGGWWQPPPPLPQQQQQHMHHSHHRHNAHTGHTQRLSRADNIVGADARRWAMIPWETLESEIVELAFSKHGSLCLQNKLGIQKISPSGAAYMVPHDNTEAMLSVVLEQLSP